MCIFENVGNSASGAVRRIGRAVSLSLKLAAKLLWYWTSRSMESRGSRGNHENLGKGYGSNFGIVRTLTLSSTPRASGETGEEEEEKQQER